MGKIRVVEAAPRILFFTSILMMAFAYGVGATLYNLFPVPWLREARETGQHLLEKSGTVLPFYFQRTDRTERIGRRVVAAAMPGLRLINALTANEETRASVMDLDGNLIHQWRIDWYKIWPDPTHLEEEVIPKSNASLVHGIAVAPNGDLIFNFEQLGMVRLNACGAVVWKVPYRTHHSIHIDEKGHIWTAGVIARRTRESSSLANHMPLWNEYTVVEVSAEGKILREWNVADLLVENGLRGLLHLSTLSNRDTTVTGDTLHLNDVETFPASMTPGVFSAGDVMISLRNTNAILVFDPKSRRVKFQSVGAVLRQHDPDFVDGNTISVFDNNNLAVLSPGETTPRPAGHYSRIVGISASDGRAETDYTGSDKEPFFTDILGTHQRLPNGNMLITEAIAGRVFEVNRAGDVVWEYFNVVGGGLLAIVPDALWLPLEVNADFFARAASTCTAPSD